jgi:hypothetical protein
MKNILMILSFIFICINCKAQQEQIIPLDTKGWPVENTYYKDLYNELDPYTGTWKGTFEGKTFVIYFTKLKHYEPIGKYYKDRIMGRYKMLDANGNQLYTTYNLPIEQAKITSLGFVNRAIRDKMRLMFTDRCIDGEIHLNFENAEKTQMHWQYFTNQTLITDNSGCAPFNEMPRGEMTLIKQ